MRDESYLERLVIEMEKNLHLLIEKQELLKREKDYLVKILGKEEAKNE